MWITGQQVICVQKTTTTFWILFLMWYYNNWTITAHVNLAMHASYGWSWMIKEVAFPHAGGMQPLPNVVVLMFLLLLVFLPGYWTIPLLGVKYNQDEAPPALIGLCIIMCGWGTCCMMVADCQTYFCLKHRPGRLVTDGMNRYVRHPNYTGEILVYASFALIARHWGAWIVFVIGNVFFNMVTIPVKEASLSKYPAWAEYCARTGGFLPTKIFATIQNEPFDQKLLDEPKYEPTKLLVNNVDHPKQAMEEKKGN